MKCVRVHEFLDMEHLDNLGLVFNQIKEAGLKLKPPKYFVYLLLLLMVYKVTDMTKTENIANWPITTNLLTQSAAVFIRLVSYYH